MARQLTRVLGECHERFIAPRSAELPSGFDARWFSADERLSALYRRGVLETLIPLAEFRAAGGEKRLLRTPGGTRVEKKTIDFLEAFFRDHADLIVSSLHWAQVWIDRSATVKMPTNTRKEPIRQRIVKNVVARLADDPNAFDEAGDEAEVLERLMQNPSMIGTLSETLTRIEEDIEAILNEKWKPFRDDAQQRRSGEAFIYGFVTEAAAEPQNWRPAHFDPETRRIRLSDGEVQVLDAFIAQLAGAAVYGLVEDGEKGPLKVRPIVRRTGGTTPPTRLDWSVEERAASALRNARLSAREFDDLGRLLIVEATASSNWLGLASIESRLCLATAKIMIEEASVRTSELLNGVEKKFWREIEQPSNLLFKAVRNIINRERLKEAQSRNLAAGDMDSSVLNYESVCSDAEETVKSSLIEMGINATWRRLHFNELRETPVDDYRNYGAFIGECVKCEVRALYSSRMRRSLAARHSAPPTVTAQARESESPQGAFETVELRGLIDFAEGLNGVIVEGEKSTDPREHVEAAQHLLSLLREAFAWDYEHDPEAQGLESRWEAGVRRFRETATPEEDPDSGAVLFSTIRHFAKEMAE